MTTKENQHPDWEKENSLTSPEDRDRVNRWRPEQGAPALTEPEVHMAMKENNDTSFIDKFPRVDRTYQDPQVPMQNIGLISFTPAKGATPNKNGVYGFAKLRGNYSTLIEAEQRAEYLIRNVDSYHKIFHTYVGRPFPLTFSSDYSAETSEIDIRKQATESISSHIKSQKDEEKKTVNDIKEREQKILEESKKAREDDGVGEPDFDPYETYITLKVKKAQIIWNFLEHLKKIYDLRDIILKTRKEIDELDSNHPEFNQKYFEKYMKARIDAGLAENTNDSQDNFIKYMIEEISVPTIDTDERLPVIPGYEQSWTTTSSKREVNYVQDQETYVTSFDQTGSSAESTRVDDIEKFENIHGQ